MKTPTAKPQLPGGGLYAVTASGLDTAALVDKTAAALQAGAALIQYRDKSAGPQKPAAEKLITLCALFDAPLIINDDPELAAAVGAAGVHLGRRDPTISQARAWLGDGALIGCSCYDDLARAEQAAREGADYLAFGACFPSPTKPAAARAALELIDEAKRRFELPVVAIGGITPGNGAAARAAGADYLAVSSGIYGDADPLTRARRYTELFSSPEFEP